MTDAPSRAPAARLVVLTYGGVPATRCLVRLAVRGVVPDAIVLTSPKPGVAAGAAPRWQRALAGSPREVVARALRVALRAAASEGTRQAQRTEWEGLSRAVVHGGELNGSELRARLEQLMPDWLILASVGIVSPEILRIPARGTVNLHHALLPWMRGNGVLERSLLHGVALGVSAHVVDAGIDTGAMLHRELLRVTTADTHASLHAKSIELGAEVLSELAVRLARGERPASASQSARFPYGRWATPDEIERARAAIARGEALRLYERWRSFYGGDVIPIGATDSPPVATSPIEPTSA